MPSKPPEPTEPGTPAPIPPRRQRRPRSSVPEHRPERGAAEVRPPRKSEHGLHRPPVHPRPAPTHEEIARRAYELWQRNGCQPGRDVEYWCQAEHELGGIGSR